ncbi:MAG TPA: DNA recombination protein RmuC [Ignavibacteria bacterium]|nr:DNA recombination protein RmuC [Ignavibacteria bacterium]
MDIYYILAGVITGIIISYVIFYLQYKVRSVSKEIHDNLSERFNETNTQLKIAEDRFLSLQQDHSKLELKFDSSESERAQLQSKYSSLLTNAENSEVKISELTALSIEYSKNINNLQSEINSLKQKNAEDKILINSLTDNLNSHKEENSKLKSELGLSGERITKISTENSTLSANNSALNEKLATIKEEIIEIQKSSHLQFEKIANQILEEKSGRFTEANKINIETLLKPLGENIDNFKKKVEETYDKESKQRFSLEEKVKDLIEQTNKISSEANNLASALKGQTKKQGNWGEMILESILQRSGLVKDREYFLQETIKSEDGKNLRPDVLVKLPDNRVIIIDSKVSLVSYERFSSAETSEEQAIHLTDHLNSLYKHIDDLHGKKYDNLETSLDFTMMFVPIEPAYLISIQSDQDLWSYAYSKRILLISPTNLIACIKLMADLWKRELQSKNAIEIVKRGELLFEKFTAFVSTLEDVGKQIYNSQKSYNTAIGQLKSGSGNLVGQALKLKDLGLKSSKEIPVGMLPDDFEPETENNIKTLPDKINNNS